MAASGRRAPRGWWTARSCAGLRYSERSTVASDGSVVSFSVPHPRQTAEAGSDAMYSWLRANRRWTRPSRMRPKSFRHCRQRHSTSRTSLHILLASARGRWPELQVRASARWHHTAASVSASRTILLSVRGTETSHVSLRAVSCNQRFKIKVQQRSWYDELRSWFRNVNENGLPHRVQASTQHKT